MATSRSSFGDRYGDGLDFELVVENHIETNGWDIERTGVEHNPYWPPANTPDYRVTDHFGVTNWVEVKSTDGVGTERV